MGFIFSISALQRFIHVVFREWLDYSPSCWIRPRIPEVGTVLMPSVSRIHQQGSTVDSSSVEQLRQQIEPLARLSASHLSASTRMRLAKNQLSVNAYSTDFGGFVYVGEPVYSVPVEPDLARIFEVASAAGAVWLQFDIDAAVIDGLPLFHAVALENT